MSWMHEENRACQYASILACVGTAAVASIIVYAVGPTTLLAEALRMLPDDPGWGWFIGWALVLLISIVLMLPMWQALCIASGLMFGRGLSSKRRRDATHCVTQLTKVSAASLPFHFG